MTLFRATVLDTPDDPFEGGALRAQEDCGLLVEGGVIVARGDFAELRALHPHADVIDLREGMVLPGLVDTHVHFPQVRVIGGLGMPLLDWLDQCALPEEMRLADVDMARGVARDFVTGLVDAGTTTALVFGSHFAPAVDVMFEAADLWGLRVTTGLVTSDRILPEPLLTTPQRAYEESRDLASRWHGKGRLRYAVTPRFSLSASDAILESCATTFREVEGSWFTSHVNENTAEVAEVAQLFGGAAYVDTYDHHGLLSPRSVLAHNVHPTDPELATLAARGASVAHCPTSNSALGSGLFPLRRHVEAGVQVAMGSDVGAGTGFSMLKEGLQAYFMQRLLGDVGLPLTSAHLLWLCTSAGARALGLGHEVGDLSVGKQFDAIWLLPQAGDPLAVGMGNAKSADDALSKVFALGTTSDIGGVWVGGDQIAAGRWRMPRRT
ncbi:guanine deaminase [Phycicoccus badiiscoriae]|uniref:Guanine deaminase n=1 Tax=Pedococcus badiiscoriae TaxID=642776 RepID=A0A852WIY8_9MICO|nr:guanine deaminase [Pedococcus badiiscoriae]NYG06614.1 guanine deaminase [Pedococcus badiiscoriae]